MDVNDVTGQIIDAAMKVHSASGPGLLESAYEACLLLKLHKRGLKAERQVPLPIVYESVTLNKRVRFWSARRDSKHPGSLEDPGCCPTIRLGYSDVGYRLDLLVEDLVIVEIKAVSELTPLFEAQLLSYLKLSNRQVGLLLNFHSVRLKDGIKRLVNRLPESTRSPKF